MRFFSSPLRSSSPSKSTPTFCHNHPSPPSPAILFFFISSTLSFEPLLLLSLRLLLLFVPDDVVPPPGSSQFLLHLFRTSEASISVITSSKRSPMTMLPCLRPNQLPLFLRLLLTLLLLPVAATSVKQPPRMRQTATITSLHCPFLSCFFAQLHQSQVGPINW